MNVFIYVLLSDESVFGLPSMEDFISKLVPNVWVFLCQLAAFIIMILVAIKFLYKPIKKFIKERQEYVKNNIEDARIKNEEADRNLEQSKDALVSSRKEAIKIVNDAKLEATKEKNAILDTTQQEIAAKQAKASEDLKRETEKAIKSVHDEVVNLAIETSKSILEREVNVKDDDTLVNELVNNLMEKK